MHELIPAPITQTISATLHEQTLVPDVLRLELRQPQGPDPVVACAVGGALRGASFRRQHCRYRLSEERGKSVYKSSDSVNILGIVKVWPG